MSRHHLIPAAYLGGFSRDSAKRLRERTVVVFRQGKIFKIKAESIAYQRDYYTLHKMFFMNNDDPEIIDKAWRFGENSLPEALEHVHSARKGGLSAQIWTTAIVPFVGQLFVRSIEFHKRYLQRLDRAFGNRSALSFGNSHDDINMARWFDWQRIMWALLQSRWIIYYNDSPTPFITSDVANIPLLDPNTGKECFFVPLRSDLGVQICPNSAYPPYYEWDGQDWAVRNVSCLSTAISEGAYIFNALLVAACYQECYGGDVQVLSQSVTRAQAIKRRTNFEPGQLLRGPNPAKSQNAYLRLMLLLSAPPSSPESSPIVMKKAVNQGG